MTFLASACAHMPRFDTNEIPDEIRSQCGPVMEITAPDTLQRS